MQRVALIGCGFMGGMHASVYPALADACLVAVVDPREEAAREILNARGLGGVPIYADYDQAARECDFSVADICLPTDLHRTVALSAFAGGHHVFCEKPISLTIEDARAMTAAARDAGRELMIGHCIRFRPEYRELEKWVRSGRAGALLGLELGRRSGRPDYSVGDWVNRPERCVGAALDLHIHDTDFIVHLLGTPDAVFSRGTQDGTGWSGIATHYLYDRFVVTASGGWNSPPRWGFQMRFDAVFENGSLDFDSRRNPTLRQTSGREEPSDLILPKLPANPVASGGNITDLGGYFQELAYFVDCLENGKRVSISSGDQATESLRVVLAEIESAASGKLVSLNMRTS